MISKKKNIFNERVSKWGGSWTEKKLDAFSKYVRSYLTIMNKNPYWKTIYFDGFAGSGYRKNQRKSDLYRQLFLNIEDESVYKGAAERVLQLDINKSFDYYYFIDSNQHSLDNLKRKLLIYQNQKENEFQYRSGDCNQILLELGKALNNKAKKLAALVFLDPFGMQINWDSIASLKNTHSDIWILVPTGVIVNRLLDKSCKLKHTEKLQSFFGLTEEEIKKIFYQKQTQNTLFGEDEIIKKVSKPIEQIAKLYMKQLKTIWSYVVEEPLILTNSRGVPIYHLIFASNNVSALKIAKQIIKTV